MTGEIRGLGLLLGAKLDGGCAPYDLGAAPKRAQAVGGAGQAEEIERIGNSIGIQQSEAVKEWALRNGARSRESTQA